MNENRTGQAATNEAHALFLQLFLSSERELFRYVAALVPTIADAEEIVQQTAVALWSTFDLYDVNKPFTPWACRFAMNMVKQWAAQRQRWRSLLDDGLAEQLARRREELRPLFAGRMKHLDACLEKLPADHRNIVNAHYFHRKGVEAIAAEARRSVDALYKTLQRIRSALRRCIERAEQIGDELA